MEDHSLDQGKRDAMLLFAFTCFLGAAANVFFRWPEVDLYALVIAAFGGAFMYLYSRGSIQSCRKVCLVLSLGVWR